MEILPTHDIETIKQIIKTDFPTITINSIKLIGTGWDNIVAEINGDYIFRFPKDSGCTFEKELKILDYLQGKTSLMVPRVKFLGKSYSYMGYKKNPGGDLTIKIYEGLTKDEKEKMIFDLANFLKDFHSSIGVEQAREAGIETEDYESYLNLINNKLKGKLGDVQISKFVDDTRAEFEAMASKQQNIVVLYNDLHIENIAFDVIKKKNPWNF